jgi:hypothetical protein
MVRHTRTVIDKVFEVWRSPDRFTKNPDVVQVPDGRLVLVYSDTDRHWSEINQVLTVLESSDLGASWSKLAEPGEAVLAAGDERLVTPRLSVLSDGRLVVIVDHDDFTHFHENQPPGNWIFWSSDSGRTWSPPQDCGIAGFEPDRIMELSDGRLAVCSHVMRAETQEFAEIIHCSDDGGASWYEQATIAHDGYHRFCEGALVPLHGGLELACVMRENHSGGIPSFVSFSDDLGRSWSPPRRLPFAFHRPFAEQLPDGRVLVTGRHVNGGLGTYAWCGDLRSEAGAWSVGGPRRKYSASLEAEALIVENLPDHECRYTMIPPEGPRSRVLFEAVIKVEGPPDQPVAFLSVPHLDAVLQIGANYVGGERFRVDLRDKVDMTRFRRVTIRHDRGLAEVLIDGQQVIRWNVFWEHQGVQDFHGGDPAKRTQFGQMGEQGRSFWKSVRYETKNPRLADAAWSWCAPAGLWPDEYQRDRLIQIHGNHPDQKPNPDHGYSSWLPLEDGRIFLVDYTNHGDSPGRSHLVGVYLEPDDYA